MKKISVLALVLAFIGNVSQADQKKEADKVVETQGSSSSFIKPETAPKMTAGTADGDCPIIGYKKFVGAWIAQYPPTSVDPDCPPK